MLLISTATESSLPAAYADVSTSSTRRLTILLEGFAPQEREKIAASLPAENNRGGGEDNNNNNDNNNHKDAEGKKNAGSRPRGGKAQLRRPIAMNLYYSSAKELQSKSAQNSAKRKRQLLLSYIGRLEETNAGIDRAPTCSPCIKKGVPCKVYTRAASKQYIARKINSNNYTYARCRFYSSQSACLQYLAINDTSSLFCISFYAPPVGRAVSLARYR